MTSKRGRGERVGLTREQILDAALDLVDRAGIAALTMRQLAADLDVEAMTLYHYVSNKDALVDGIVERVFTGVPATAPDDAGWPEYLRRYAGALRETLLRHPGVLSVIVRPATTPATLDAVEAALGKLTGAGFPLGRAVDALNALTLFVIGHTTAEAALSGDDGPGSLEWLRDLDEHRYPVLISAARTGAGADDLERFDYAVDALLTGFAASLPR